MDNMRRLALLEKRRRATTRAKGSVKGGTISAIRRRKQRIEREEGRQHQ